MKRVCFEFGSTNVGSSVIGTGRSEGSLLLLPYFCQFRYYYPLITYLKPKISSWHILTSSFRSKSRLLTFITFIFFSFVSCSPDPNVFCPKFVLKFEIIKIKFFFSLNLRKYLAVMCLITTLVQTELIYVYS